MKILLLLTISLSIAAPQFVLAQEHQGAKATAEQAKPKTGARKKKAKMCEECGKPEAECECHGHGHGHANDTKHEDKSHEKSQEKTEEKK